MYSATRVTQHVVLFLAFAAGPAMAAECSNYGDMLEPEERSMDRYLNYRICDRSGDFVSRYWDTFGFRKKYWDDGFGYEDVCNSQKPLGRTLSALYLLQYSFSPAATSLSDWSGSAVRWGYPYSATIYQDLNDLRARCGNGRDFAEAFIGRGDNRIELYLESFYELSALERAGNILHEAHHMGVQRVHSCGRGADRNWSDWLPFASETYYYISYYRNANAHTNSAWKEYAADKADAMISGRFCNQPPAWVQNFR